MAIEELRRGEGEGVKSSRSRKSSQRSGTAGCGQYLGHQRVVTTEVVEQRREVQLLDFVGGGDGGGGDQ